MLPPSLSKINIRSVDISTLLFCKNFRVGVVGGGSRGGDSHRRVEIECDRGEAQFVTASLVAELQRNVLFAEGGVCKCRDGHAKNHRVLVDIQRGFGKGKFFELALGVGNFTAVEACRKRGLEIGGDEVVFRFFSSMDVKAGTILT